MGMFSAIKLLIQHPLILPGPPWTRTGNWNGGVATSGLPGADLFSYGAANQWWRMGEAYLRLASFNAAATVTIRAYITLLGAERTIMDDDWVVALDGEIAYIIWFWDVQILGPLRVEVYSNMAADDGLAVPHEYRVKDW